MRRLTDFNIEMRVKYKCMVSTLNYAMTIRARRLSEVRLLSGKIRYYVKNNKEFE